LLASWDHISSSATLWAHKLKDSCLSIKGIIFVISDMNECITELFGSLAGLFAI